MTSNSETRLDRLERVVEQMATTMIQQQGNAELMMQAIRINSDQIVRLQTEVRDLQVEMRDLQVQMLGMQTETRRILDNLLGEEN